MLDHIVEWRRIYGKSRERHQQGSDQVGVGARVLTMRPEGGDGSGRRPEPCILMQLQELAERHLLGCLMNDNDAWWEAARS